MSNTQHINDSTHESHLYDDSDSVLNHRNTNNVSNNSIASNNQNGRIPSSSSSSSSSTIANNKHESTNTKNVFMKLKTYLFALRPWSLSASLVPTLLGSALAYRSSTPHEFNPLTFILTIFTVVTVHGAGNVVNTYYDYVKGIDNRKSDDRTLVDHILSKDEVNEPNICEITLIIVIIINNISNLYYCH